MDLALALNLALDQYHDYMRLFTIFDQEQEQEQDLLKCYLGNATLVSNFPGQSLA